MVMTFRLDCTDPARIRTTYDQCQAWSALTLDYCLVIVFTHTDRLHFCNCFVLAVCMFLYCRVSVLFVAYILFSVGMAYRPWGHGSAPLAGPFDAIPSTFDSFVAAHGADLFAYPLGKANADPHEEGVERVNSRSSQGCLAQRATTTTSGRECVPGGGSSEPLDRKPTCTSVNSDVTLHGALTEEYPVPLSLAQREYANGMLALPSEGIVNAIADEPLNFQVLNSQACSNELAMGDPPSSHPRQETENVERDILPLSLPTATIVGQANANPDNGSAYSSMNLSEYNLQGTCSLCWSPHSICGFPHIRAAPWTYTGLYSSLGRSADLVWTILVQLSCTRIA